MRINVTLICPQCGTPFKVPRGGHERRNHCSKPCAMRSRGGEKHPSYKGGSINHGGYKMISRHGVRRYEHRVVMERHLGRELSRDEIVHHKDGDKLNNDISNLEILAQGDHSRLHCSQIEWARKHDRCKICGTTERPHRAKGMCGLCYGRAWKPLTENLSLAHATKLNETQVKQIRSLYAEGRFTQRELSRSFGVRQDYISRIVNNKVWVR